MDVDFETELATCTLSETQLEELIRRSKLTGLPYQNRNGKELLRELHRVNLYARSKFDITPASPGLDRNVVVERSSDPIYGDPVDGDPIDGDPIDGDPIDGDPIDGDPIDGEPIDL